MPRKNAAESSEEGYLLEDRSGAIADKCEAGPVDGKSLVAELFQKIEFGLPQCSALFCAIGEMLIHAFHESNGERVIRWPQACDHRLCTGQKKRPFEAGDSLLTEQFSRPGIASGESYQFGAQTQISDFSNLQQTIIPRSG